MKSKCIIVLLIFSASIYAEDSHFYEVFGISINTRIYDIDLKTLYPNAKFSESRSRVSKIDSVDDINSITLKENYTRINFKAKTKCRKIFNVIYRKYKGPDTVSTGYEVNTKYQYRGWHHNKESIHLLCHYYDNDKYVEKISFEKKN